MWSAQDPPTAQPPETRVVVQSERGDDAVPAVAAPAPLLTNSAPSAWRVDSNPSTEFDGLVVALGDADANVRVDAVADLRQLGDMQVESLLAMTAMQDPAPLVRIEALYALESLRAGSQLAAFRHALADPDKDVRKAAISALEELGGNASTELLRAALSDRDAAIRASAAVALADLKNAK